MFGKSQTWCLKLQSTLIRVCKFQNPNSFEFNTPELVIASHFSVVYHKVTKYVTWQLKQMGGVKERV